MGRVESLAFFRSLRKQSFLVSIHTLQAVRVFDVRSLKYWRSYVQLYAPQVHTIIQIENQSKERCSLF